MHSAAVNVEAPASPQALTIFPDTGYNLVVWEDVPGEENETYTIYRSHTPIDENNLTEGYVHVISSGIVEGLQSFTDWLYRPLNDQDMTYFYAVSCSDESSNESLPGGTTIGTTNTGIGIPVISLEPPAGFSADGNLSEWYGSPIVPFEINPTNGNVAAGTVDDADDLSATVFLVRTLSRF